jgi:preprotein translocase subunit SecE
MATQVGKLKNEEAPDSRPSFDASGLIARMGEAPRRWRGFLHDVRVEMRQVTWPTRHEVFVTTWVVIVTVAFFGFYFFGVDSAASWLVQRAIKFFGH